MEIDLKDIKFVLETRGKTTAEDAAKDLNLPLTQAARKKTLQKVRAALRKVVDTNGGKRDEVNNEGQQIYEL